MVRPGLQTQSQDLCQVEIQGRQLYQSRPCQKQCPSVATVGSGKGIVFKGGSRVYGALMVVTLLEEGGDDHWNLGRAVQRGQP